MEHTHLVKGLDFALLQKVSADITVLLLPCPLPQTHRVGVTAWSWQCGFPFLGRVDAGLGI